jgi:probable rRNA maturation factor
MTAPALTVELTLLRSVRAPRAAFRPADLRALAHFTLSSERVGGRAQLTVDVTGHARIRALNRRFRGVDRTTDVISFRNDEDQGRRRGLDGDLAINVTQAAVQASKMRHPLRREMRLLLIHGLLHLLGYTDYAPVPRRRMFKRQNELLRRWEKRARP